MMRTSTRQASGVIGIGYQGHEIDSFILGLVNAGVSRVVDVRLTPISRKPGFSKRRLAEALGNAGIRYEHRPELGNPKPNRAGFAGSPEQAAAARDAFGALLARRESAEAIASVHATAQSERVALLCYEADQRCCHRDVLLAELGQRFNVVAGSRRQGC